VSPSSLPSELCEAILDASPDPILLIDENGMVRVASARVRDVLGYAPERLVGQPVEVLVPSGVAEAHVGHRRSFMARPRVRDMSARDDLVAIHAEGSEVPVEISLSPIAIDGEPHVVVILRDVTERRKVERELRYHSTHDALTDVYNRAFFQAEVERLDVGRRPTSVIVVDLDGLKEVNDEHGHAEGDRMLRRMAAALRGSFRKEDVVARIGGDEFAVLLPGVGSEGLRDAIRRLLADVGRMNEVHRGRPVLFSLGTGTATAPGMLEQTLLRADQQMYAQKRSRGRGRSRDSSPTQH
jgi:diguanylate cyclase (GGDEF)-like protein/PAS domain S-box-containing protein